MAESGPPPAGPGTNASDYRSWFTRLVGDHPGTWLTFLYLALTAIGLAYAFAYYAPFGISFLDYAFTFTLMYGRHQGEKVRNGIGKRVRVQLASAVDARPGHPRPCAAGA